MAGKCREIRKKTASGRPRAPRPPGEWGRLLAPRPPSVEKKPAPVLECSHGEQAQDAHRHTDFETLRTDGCVYVDKTDLIYDLVQNGKPYFLSRTRLAAKLPMTRCSVVPCATFPSLLYKRAGLHNCALLEQAGETHPLYPHELPPKGTLRSIDKNQFSVIMDSYI